MTTRISTMDQVRAFVAGTHEVEFEVPSRLERRAWIAENLEKMRYEGLGRTDKGMLVRYLCRITGYSRQQLTRLVRQWRETGALEDRRGPPAKPFTTRYTEQDVLLLAQMDVWHNTLSGPATKKLCERAVELYGDRNFARLAGISVSHLYNLRRSKAYVRKRGKWEKTKPTRASIGQRRVPRPQGRPGYVRVDSVHTGDWDGVKGLYFINMVDEVTQFQHVAALPRLNEMFVMPALERLLDAFPFTIRGFHADNGSEYVNHQVAGLLGKLLVEFTKSRPRRSNDNALVESKNGSVVRKHFGYGHIPGRVHEAFNAFLTTHLNPYLNYHRPCFYPVTVVDSKGRIRKLYPYKNLMTPFDKLESLPDAQSCLKPQVSLDGLHQLAEEISDNEAARRLNKARDALYRNLHLTPTVA